jgi:hypothetical protein
MPPLTAPELSPPRSSWLRMSVDRYAALERATAVKVVKKGNIWWHQIRPFLYRPLLPFKKYDLKTAREGFSKISAFQHCVEDGQPHNSCLNPVVFDELHSYDLKNMPGNVQRHVKKALRNRVTVSRIVDEREFSEKAYPVYLSFYERTKYGFDPSRRRKNGFSRWAHAVFKFHEAVVLGAFAGQELVGFEISCLIENTLILKTIVHSQRALRLGCPDLLLHHYRISALEQPDIHAIYDSMLAGNPGINEFKIVRGAKVLALPAFLNIHPIVLWWLKNTTESIYSRLHGFDMHDLRARNLIR